MKKCVSCKLEKEEGEFYKCKANKDGLSSWCKGCFKEYQKEYRKTDKYKKCQEKYQKLYRGLYKRKRRHKKYKYQVIFTKIKRGEYKKEYVKKRRLIDPKYKLDDNMSSAIRKALKGKKAGRKWEELVGYTVEDLMAHLESKFEPWMNWDNYGKWHIDHIKPKSLFNYDNSEDKEFKECWALSNLQPLLALENLKKGNKYKINLTKNKTRYILKI